MNNIARNMTKRFYLHYAGFPVAVWMRCIINILQVIATAIGFFFSYYFVKDLHFSLLAAGQLMAIYSAGTFIGGIGSGYLCDRFPAHTISWLTLLLNGIALIAFLYFTSFTMLSLNLLVLGFSSYAFKTANTYWTLAYYGENNAQKLKVISLLYMSSNFGIGLSMVMVSLLSPYGFHCIVSTAVIIAILPGLYFCWRAPSLPIRPSVAPLTQSDALTIPLKNKSLLLFIIALSILFLGGLIFAQLSSTYTIYLTDKFPTWGLHSRSIMTIVNVILVVLLQAPLVSLLNHFNQIRLAGIGGFILSLGFFIVSLSSSFSIALLSCVVYTVGEMLLVAMTHLVCYETAPAQKKGRNIGWAQGITALSRIVGAIVGSEIYHHHGGDAVWSYGLYVGAFSLLLGIIGSCSLEKNLLFHSFILEFFSKKNSKKEL